MIRQARECARRVLLTPLIPFPRLRTGSARLAAAGSRRAGSRGTDRDHMEEDLGQVAGVSDRGLRHSRNEDAMHFAVADTDDGPVAVAIVCDGVSSAPRPDEASWTAVNAGITLLAEGAERGDDPREPSRGRRSRPPGRRSTELAGPDGAPATTCVSAVVTAAADHGVLARRQPRLLARRERGAPGRPERHHRHHRRLKARHQGRLARRGDRRGGPRVHGRGDRLPAGARDHPLARRRHARAASRTSSSSAPSGHGVLLLCSDGLWNYRPEAAELASMAMPAALTRPLDAASRPGEVRARLGRP